MITRETDYAIRVVIRLAEADKLSVSKLSEELGVPYRFLRKICLKLVKAKLLKSSSGKGGGLTLGSAYNLISLLDIIEATNPDSIKLNACLINNDVCSNSINCVVHSSLNELQKRLNEALSQLTLERLLAKKRSRNFLCGKSS
jgi:Rrf2 family protein